MGGKREGKGKQLAETGEEGNRRSTCAETAASQTPGPGIAVAGGPTCPYEPAPSRQTGDHRPQPRGEFDRHRRLAAGETAHESHNWESPRSPRDTACGPQRERPRVRQPMSARGVRAWIRISEGAVHPGPDWRTHSEMPCRQLATPLAPLSLLRRPGTGLYAGTHVRRRAGNRDNRVLQQPERAEFGDRQIGHEQPADIEARTCLPAS